MAFTLFSPLVNIPLQGLPIAAAALDPSGAIVAANQQFTRLCRHPDPVRSGLRLAEIVAEPDRKAVEDAINGLAVADNRAAQRCSIRALRAKPPALWLAIDITRLGTGAVVPYLACVQTMSRRRRVDNPPHRKPQRRNGTPSGAATESAAWTMTRTVEPWPPFVETLSHEFRGPLTAIRGWTEIAERCALPPDKMSQALAVISRNAASLSDMIENVFDLSRRAAGSLELMRQVLDLNPLTQLVVESTLPAARHHDVVLTAKRTNAALFVNGDPFRLEQVVRNLVDNAIKFTPGGHVHVHTATDGVHAEIVVSDNGFGIPRDLLPTIFEPFRHHDAIVRPSKRGLGLGLALVRELVQLHHGDVRALSAGDGQGATFIVRLPLANTAVAA